MNIIMFDIFVYIYIYKDLIEYKRRIPNA